MMEVIETRELADDRAFIEGRPPTMLYVIAEAPEGHGALPNPRDVTAHVIVLGKIVGDMVVKTQYRKEQRRCIAMRTSGQLEVWEYLVWVPW